MNEARLFGPPSSRRRLLARSVRALLQLPRTVERLDAALEHAAIGQTYRAISELVLRGWPALRPLDLRGSEFRVFSQNGEDGVLAALRTAFPPADPYFVEFGVQTGAECNTRFLAEVLGWQGVYFEPDRRSFEALRTRYLHTSRVRCAAEAVTPQEVGAQFARLGVPDRFAVLSIDVDGQDYWIWKALPDRYRPDVVVIEYNARHEPGRAVVERPGLPWSWPPARNSGGSIEAFRRLGEHKGYRLVHVELAGVNAFFVREELLPTGLEVIGITDRSPNPHLRGRGPSRLRTDCDVVDLDGERPSAGPAASAEGNGFGHEGAQQPTVPFGPFR